ncbi:MULTISPECIES: right-handed parallel beta-helix repeat-containing protein [unclassified Cryobacterium]|uniref:right-handed parallel beta-helix repeat-containing protein n=1 Tax=unclassified Cryobacterium TaxID=2649013 RepID=UPI002AB43BEB|nr:MULTISPECIES: right-handed parallel beta-helix repeat-containing protein [unclassified Cryobacterium]MDY7541751.1 right-handed parallel beta-helix repeat-containing protein [Cryobacterium sp. 5B3]MEB0000191.1 right-handed parallel beta-helix repeat-containing protein [Cryobacterium sp. RTS3]MEB0266663.1 right-handed parallel beta-helix repeat-containing protein [Cryobacterium sp. 10I5]MEB0275862.1 right-handed parallel beta-helix repeat-containing protein [Cryobacterium sp. 5B3]
MSIRRPILLTALVLIVLSAIGATWILGINAVQQSAATSPGESAHLGRVLGLQYAGDPNREAALVTGESQRLEYVRTMAVLAPSRVHGLRGPFRLETNGTFTLILPGRDTPYTLTDMLALAPDTFVRQPDGSFLLAENLVILAGATLKLDAPDGLTLRLKSDPTSFVSIVALGGSLNLSGTSANQATITSWDPGQGTSDTTTSDGRAYIRAVGGDTHLTYVQITNLGFWSGNTGGLALTGIAPSSTFKPAIGAPASGTEIVPNGAPLLTGSDLEKTTAGAAQQNSPASATISHVTVTGNAYGIFASNARGVTVYGTQIRGSLIDGVALHEAVTDTTISDTTSIGNSGDGFSLYPSSSNVLYQDDAAANNGRDGFNIDGQPLAVGPGPSGSNTLASGENRIVKSISTDNTRNGIGISGGQNVEVSHSSVARNEDGIVVDDGAANVVLTDNTLQQQRSRGITIRDAGASSTVYRNTITGGDTGVSLRNSTASVTGNVLTEITNHGLDLEGDTSHAHISDNTVSGTGSVPIWPEVSAIPAVDGAIGNNDIQGWHPAPTIARITNWVFQPLTVVWLFLATLLVGSAFTRRTYLRRRRIRSPFADPAQLAGNDGAGETSATVESIPAPAQRL